MPNHHTEIPTPQKNAATGQKDADRSAKLEQLILPPKNSDHPRLNQKIALELCHPLLLSAFPEMTTMAYQAIWYALYWHDRGQRFWTQLQKHANETQDNISDPKKALQITTFVMGQMYKDKLADAMITWQHYLLKQHTALRKLQNQPAPGRMPRKHRKKPKTIRSAANPDHHLLHGVVKNKIIDKVLLAQALFTQLIQHHPHTTNLTLLSAISVVLVYGEDCGITTEQTFERTWQGVLGDKDITVEDTTLASCLLDTLRDRAARVLANETQHAAHLEAHHRWLLEPAHEKFHSLRKALCQQADPESVGRNPSTLFIHPTATNQPPNKRKAVPPSHQARPQLKRRNGGVHPSTERMHPPLHPC